MQLFLLNHEVLNNTIKGARGVSLLFSSGDYGVGDGNPDPAKQECFTNDGHNKTRFIPVFPSTCVLRYHLAILSLTIKPTDVHCMLFQLCLIWN